MLFPGHNESVEHGPRPAHRVGPVGRSPRRSFCNRYYDTPEPEGPGRKAHVSTPTRNHIETPKLFNNSIKQLDDDENFI